MSETLEIGSVKPRIRYEGDGTTTEFSFAFTIFDETDVDVYADDALLTEGYSVSRETQGGRVIFDKAPATGTIITLYRSLELKRTTNFQEVGPFRTSKVNLEFDYQLACMEQLQDTISRTVTFPPYAPTQLNVALPMPVPGKAIIWNAEGNSLQNSTIEIEKLTACYDDVLKKAQEVCNNAAAAASACQKPKAPPKPLSAVPVSCKNAPKRFIRRRKTWAALPEPAASPSNRAFLNIRPLPKETPISASILTIAIPA